VAGGLPPSVTMETEMQKELGKLQGQWNVTSLEVDGASVSPGAFAGARIVIEGDRFTSLGMGSAYSGTMSLSADASPKAFSMKFTDGPEAGNTNRGIYELDGDDLKLLQGRPEQPRPTEIKTTPKSELEILMFKRATSGAEGKDK